MRIKFQGNRAGAGARPYLLLLLITFFSVTPAQAKPWWKLLLGEGDGTTGGSDAAGVGAALKSYITSATFMTYVANYSWGTAGSVNAVEAGLNTANGAGKDARVVADDTADTGDLTLPAAKIKGRVQAGAGNIMHDKFIITDPNQSGTAKMVTGSGNFSGGGWTSQNNTFLFLFGPNAQPVIQKYRDEFNEMWGGTFNGGTSGFNTDTVNGTTVNSVFGPEVGPWTNAGSLTTKVGAATKSVFFETTGHDPNNGAALSIDTSIWGELDAQGAANFLVEGVVNSMGGFAPTFGGSALAGYNSRSTEVRRSAITSFDKHHHKYFVVDQDWVWLGSVNASASSSQGGSGSDENGLLIQDFRLARELMKEFHRNYHLGSPVGSIDNTGATPAQTHDDAAPAQVASLSITPGGASFTASWTPLGATPDFHAYYLFLSTQAITTQADIGDRSDNDADGMIDEDPLGDIDRDGDRDDDKDGAIDEDKSLRPEVRVFGIGSGSSVISTWDEGETLIPARDYWFAVVGVDRWGNESLVRTAGPFQTSGGGGSAPTAAASAQFKSDGTTQISTGATTNETTVKFKASLYDVDGQTIKLQVEIQPVGAAFANAANTTDSTFVSNGTVAEVTWASGVNGTSYHWQYRPVDSGGSTGTWASFGGNPEPSGVDFTVTLSSNAAPTAPVVTYPNGGENLVGNSSTFTITWTAATDPDGPNTLQYFIEYTTSTLNSTWVVISTGTTGTSRAWNPVPNLPTTQAKVRIKAYDGTQFGLTDESNAVFTILAANSPPTAPVVTAPNGGETWPSPSNQNITWTAASDPNTPITYTIQYSTDGGTAWTNIATTPTGTNFWWGVPTGLNSSTSLIRIKAVDSLGASGPYDNSNGFFTLGGGGGGSIGPWETLTAIPFTTAEGTSLVGSGTNNFLFATAGNSNALWRYNTGNNTWNQMADALLTMNKGAGLAWDGGGFIYAVKGGALNRFMRYDIAGNSWANMANVTQPVNGGAITWGAGTNIYVIPANTLAGNVPYVYDTGTNAWTAIAALPTNNWGANAIGTSLSFGGGSFIYAHQGNNRNVFVRYNTGNNVWNTMAVSPTNSNTHGGGSLAWDSGNWIYAMQGGGSNTSGTTRNGFYRYNTGNNVWETLENTPSQFTLGLTSPRLSRSGNYVYALHGETNAFWRFQVLSGGAPGNIPSAPTVFNPNGGETYTVGQSTTISWIAATGGDGALVYDVEYSTSGGINWATVASGISGLSTAWTVPSTPTTQGLVRVRARDTTPDSGPWDSSNGFFTVNPVANLPPTAPVVGVPNGGENWAAGQVRTITWTAATDPDSGPSVLTYTIEYSTSGAGGPWIPITSGVSGTAYSWTVPDTQTSDAFVRIYAFDGASYGPSDSSNAAFSISSSLLSILISEVMHTGSGADNEFIELYNPTGSTITLAGNIRLVTTSQPGTTSFITLGFIRNDIKPYGYFLIGTTLGWTGSLTPDATYSIAAFGKLATNSGVMITTITAFGATGTLFAGKIDAVGMGTQFRLFEAVTTTSPAAGGSIERKATGGADPRTSSGNSYDTNNNWNDFMLFTSSYPQNSLSPAEVPALNLNPAVSALVPNSLQSWSNDSTPNVTFSQSDPNGGDTLKFYVQFDDEATFAAPRWVYFISALGSQGAASFDVGQATGTGSYPDADPTVGQSEVLPDGQYRWQVQTEDNSGAPSGYTQAASGGVVFRIDTVPPVTTALSALAGQGIVTLSWTAFTDATSGLNIYKIYRSTWSIPAGTFPSVKDDPSKVLARNDDGVAGFTDQSFPINELGNTTYYYRVTGIDLAGNESAGSNEVFAFPTALVAYLYPTTVITGASGDTTTEQAVPAVSLDITTAPVTDGTPFDSGAGDGWYTVAQGQTLYIDSFNVTGQSGGIIGVKLVVNFRVEAGYGGTNAIQYQIQGGALQSTSIIPVSSQTADTQMFFELPIDSWTTLGELNIRFNNNDPSTADGVAFNWVRIEVIYASPGVPSVTDVVNDNTGLSNGGNDTAIPVTIRGNKFSGFTKATLNLGGTQLTGTAVLWPNAQEPIEIRGLTIPAATPAAIYNIIVYAGGANNDGTGTGDDFEVIDLAPSTPTVTNVIPATGLQTSTTPVEIQGTGFVGVFWVHLNNPAQTTLTGAMTVFNTFLPHKITGLSVPAGVPIGAWDVIVHAAGGTNTVSGVKFTVTAAASGIPEVTGIDPSGGTNDVDVPLTIFGENFSGASWVALKNTVTGATVGLGAPTVNAFGTQLTGVSVPAGIASGLYDVLVTNAFGTNLVSDEKYNASAPCASPGHIVISEVLAIDAGANGGEFIELYNPNGFPVDISGWTLAGPFTDSSDVTTIPSGKIIQAKGYFLVADNTWATGKDNPSWPAADYDGESIALNNTAYGLRLHSGTTNDAIVDAVGWGAAGVYKEGTAIADPTAGKAAERKAFPTSTAVSMAAGGTDEWEGNSEDTDNNATDWIAANSTPTPQSSASGTESCAGPILLARVGDGVGPTAGFINSTTFTFSVTYTHRDNLAPTKAQVIVDGVAYNMTALSTGTYSGGKVFISSRTFSTTGAKKAFFYFEQAGFTKQTPLLIDGNGNFIPVVGGLLTSVNAWSLSDGGVTANPKRGSTNSLAPTMTIEAWLSPAGGFLGSGYKATLYYSTSTVLPPNRALGAFAYAPMTFVSSSGDADLFTFTLTSGTHYRAGEAIEFYIKGVDIASSTIYDDAVSTPTDNPAVGATIEDTTPSATGPRHWFVMASTGWGAGAQTANMKMRLRNTIGQGATWDNTSGWSDWVTGVAACGAETNYMYNNQDVELTVDVVPGGVAADRAYFYYTLDGSTPTTASRYFNYFLTGTSNFIGIIRTNPSPQMGSATRYTLAVPSDIHVAGRSLRFAAYLKDQSGVFRWSTQFVYKMLQTPGNPAGDKSATIIAGRGAASKKYPSFGFNDYSPIFHAFADTALLAAATQQLKQNVSTPRYFQLDSYGDNYMVDIASEVVSGSDGYVDYFYGMPVSVYLRTAYGDSAPAYGLGSEAYVVVNSSGIWVTQPDQLTPVDAATVGGTWDETDPYASTNTLNQEALKFDWLYSSVNSKIKGGAYGDSDLKTGGIPELAVGKYVFRVQDADGLGTIQWVYRGPDGTSRVTDNQATAQNSPWSIKVLQDDLTRPFAYSPVYLTSLQAKGEAATGNLTGPLADTGGAPSWPRQDPGGTEVIGNSLSPINIRVGLADTKDARADFSGTEDYRAMTPGTVFRTYQGPTAEAGDGVKASNEDGGLAGSFDSGITPNSVGDTMGLAWDSPTGKKFTHQVVLIYAFTDNPNSILSTGDRSVGTAIQFIAIDNTDGDTTGSVADRPGVGSPLSLPVDSKTGMFWSWTRMQPMPGHYDPTTGNGIWEGSIVPPGSVAETLPYLYYRIWACNNDFDPQKAMLEGKASGQTSYIHGTVIGRDIFDTHKSPYGSVYDAAMSNCDGRIHDMEYGWATQSYYAGVVTSPPRIKITATVAVPGATAKRKLVTYITTKGSTSQPDKVHMMQFGTQE